MLELGHQIFILQDNDQLKGSIILFYFPMEMTYILQCLLGITTNKGKKWKEERKKIICHLDTGKMGRISELLFNTFIISEISVPLVC